MNELVSKVQNFLATDARATPEPGGLVAFSDDKIRIIADTAGSMKVRIFDAVTGERVFIGNENSEVSDGAQEWVSYIDELSGNSVKALVAPVEGNGVTLVTPSAPQPVNDDSDTKREELSIQIEQEKIDNNGGSLPVGEVVSTLFPHRHTTSGGQQGEEVVSDSN